MMTINMAIEQYKLLHKHKILKLDDRLDADMFIEEIVDRFWKYYDDPYIVNHYEKVIDFLINNLYRKQFLQINPIEFSMNEIDEKVNKIIRNREFSF